MPEVTIKWAEEYDALELATTIRDDDRMELEASLNMPTIDAIIGAMGVSDESYTVLVDGRVMAIYGVALFFGAEVLGIPIHSQKLRIGEAWAVTSKEVDEHPKLFWRLSKVLLDNLLGRWDVLFNRIDARYERALRWGRRLGFEFGAPAEMPSGVEFIPFKVESCAHR